MLQPKILEVKPLEGNKLLLKYETGENKIFDVTPYLLGGWFGKLKDIKLFNTVHVSGLSIEWAGGQDISPHELYDNSLPL